MKKTTIKQRMINTINDAIIQYATELAELQMVGEDFCPTQEGWLIMRITQLTEARQNIDFAYPNLESE